jgi:hypothetical protein
MAPGAIAASPFTPSTCVRSQRSWASSRGSAPLAGGSSTSTVSRPGRPASSGRRARSSAGGSQSGCINAPATTMTLATVALTPAL